MTSIRVASTLTLLWAIGGTAASVSAQNVPSPAIAARLQRPAMLSSASTTAEPSTARALRTRQRVARIHRGFGIATWSSMAVTAVLGFLQLWDEYGLARSQPNTPCARGDAVLGYCGHEVPIAHLVAGLTTTALYATTAILSFQMPDPLDYDTAEDEHARRVRLHKRLRWVHVASFVASLALGAITANIDASYEVRRGLAWAHFGTSLVTFGALSAAGAIMLF